MKYLLTVLLALAGNVKVSDSVCEQIITQNQNFRAICAQFKPGRVTKLPHPNDKTMSVQCLDIAKEIINTDFNCFAGSCYDVVKDSCEELKENPKCVDSTEICAWRDKLVPYAPKKNRFQSKFFADCTNGPKHLEVEICYSQEENETCVFDPKMKKCVSVKK